MHCDNCHQNEATVHITMDSPKGSKHTVHFCMPCILKGSTEGTIPFPADQASATLKTCGTMLGAPAAEAVGADQDELGADENPVAAVCPDCGFSDVMFRRQQRLGCPSCYDTFAVEIRAILPSLHRRGTSHHRGRSPAVAATAATAAIGDGRLRTRRLGEQLRQAIAAEDYERASRLRDEIRSLGTGAGEESP